MRHQKRIKKLGRTASHRKALLSNLAASLIEHKKIKTTDAKARATQRYIEPLITKAKRGTLHDIRQVLKKIPRKDIVKTLFDDIAPKYEDRQGGYTRIIKLGYRDNDCAAVSMIELVDFVDISKSKTTEPAKKSKKKDSEAETDIVSSETEKILLILKNILN